MTTLRQAAQQALEALTSTYRFSESPEVARTIRALRAALAEPVQEPVAWRFEARHIDSAWAAAVTLKHPGAEGVYMRNVMPLYTAPPHRKPLSEEDIKKLLIESAGMTVQFSDIDLRLARAIERAHGIV